MTHVVGKEASCETNVPRDDEDGNSPVQGKGLET